jgi:hypothetical protein
MHVLDDGDGQTCGDVECERLLERGSMRNTTVCIIVREVL